MNLWIILDIHATKPFRRNSVRVRVHVHVRMRVRVTTEHNLSVI